MRTEVRRSAALDAIIGEDPGLRAALARAALVAPTGTPVLVTGESGTGKELVARALHELGPNPGGPFVAVNCGALPRELAESELFGHERGAFTGAAARRVGWFEEASGGTLVLDEIGELPLDLQPKLLRILETGRLRRVGGAGEVAVHALELSPTPSFRLAEDGDHPAPSAPAPAHLPLPDDAIQIGGRSFDEIEREIFGWALRRNDGSRRRAARALRIARSTFCDKVK